MIYCRSKSEANKKAQRDPLYKVVLQAEAKKWVNTYGGFAADEAPDEEKGA